MIINSFQDPFKFEDNVRDFLIQYEAENNLIFSILDGIKSNRYTGENLMVSIESKGEIIMVAVMTPPHNLVLSLTQETKSIDQLINYIDLNNIDVPGVLAFNKGARRFAEIWSKKKALSFEVVMNERIYKLENVNEKALGSHEFIIASSSQEAIILNWRKFFIEEALPHENSDLTGKRLKIVKQEINNGRFFLLMDKGSPVSMVRKAGKTPNGNLINLVYTPPHLRRNGYATEVVAKISKHLLDEGNTFCFLFTDLSNSTSNKIYQYVGYRPVTDLKQYKFNLIE